MNQPLEHRIAQLEASVEHLNGAYEQIDKRLGDLRSDTVAGFVRVDQRFDAMERRSDLRFEAVEGRLDAIDTRLETKYDKLDSKVDASVRMLVTWMIGNTGIVLAAIAAVAFLRH
ncbi:MAG TPA: hypothetical protein VGG89_11465 [Candidatus Baltobacteraceae bacterium]